jgi:hypothetical protein
MFQYTVAEKLGMTLQQLRASMTTEELLGWSAYYSIRAEEEKKAYEAAKHRH